MKHKKKEHADKVERCRKFLQGACDKSAELCWFLHEEGTKDVPSEEIDEEDNSVFHVAEEIAPPDPKTMMEMITKLSFQMKWLTERTLNQKIQ